MCKMSDEQYARIKEARDKKPEAFDLAVILLHNEPDAGFMTVCSFYQRDLNCSFADARAHAIKKHPECFAAFIEANRR